MGSQRATASAVIGFGLVSIPIKLFLSAKEERFSFNMISPKGNRLKQQYIDAGTSEIVEQSDTKKGYEFAKGQYVTFTKEEFEALRAAKDNRIEIKEFVPVDSIGPLRIDKSQYSTPKDGGDRAYRLLWEIMQNKGLAAVGIYATHGKEHLVALAPDPEKGLVLHQLYYDQEMRSFENDCAKVELSDAERDMAGQLIAQLTKDEFDASNYRDQFGERVLAAVASKRADANFTVAAAADGDGNTVVDLFEQLKASMDKAKDKKTAPKKKAAAKKAAAKKTPARNRQRKPARKSA